MDSWGTAQGLSEDDVLSAVQKHMFHGDKTRLRFSLARGDGKGLLIRVQPRSRGDLCSEETNETVSEKASREVGGWKHCANWSNVKETTTQTRWMTKSAGDHKSQRNSEPWRDVARPHLGNSWRHSEAWNSNDWSYSPDASPPKRRATAHRDDESVTRWVGYMLRTGCWNSGIALRGGEWASLDELVKHMDESQLGVSVRDAADLREVLAKADTVGRFEVKQGCVRKVPHNLRKDPKRPESEDTWRGSEAWNSNDWSFSRDTIPPQQHVRETNTGDDDSVTRWVGYMLRKGCWNSGIALYGGEWANLDELAKSVDESQLGVSVRNAADLCELLAKADTVGRFEVNEGYVRKVPRNERRPQDPGRVRRRTESWPAENIVNCAVKGESSSCDESSAYVGSLEGPDGPPGAFWQQFQDNGVIWWYYEGPQGKWWCQEPDLKPKVFAKRRP